MPRLKEFVGLHGQVFFRNGEFVSQDIRDHFVRVTKADGLSPGDLVWSLNEKEGCFSLCPTVLKKNPPGSGEYVYRVPDEDGLMRLIEHEPRAFKRWNKMN
jgi:hypothetical protein